MQLQLKKLFMGFHLKIKIIHRHVVGGEKKVLQTENLQACITGQIVFVLGSFGSKATRPYSSTSTKTLWTLSILPAT